MNPAEPVDNWRVVSPTSYQTAPPRERIMPDAEWFVKRAALLQQQRKLITGSEILQIRNLARAKFLQMASQIFGVDSRRITDGSIILVVTKQELFRFTLFAKRAVNPFFHGAGNHGAPQFLHG